MELYFLCCIPIWIFLVIGTAIVDKSLSIGEVFGFAAVAIIPALNIIAAFYLFVHVMISDPVKRFFSHRLI
jgi:hypothetical protein